MLELLLPFPPSLNSYYRTVNNRILISKRGREYRNEVVGLVVLQRLKRFDDNRVEVSIMLRPPDKRRRDLDNYLKVVFDAITHSGLWSDDSNVDRISIERGEVIKDGLLVVRIAEIKSGV